MTIISKSEDKVEWQLWVRDRSINERRHCDCLARRVVMGKDKFEGRRIRGLVEDRKDEDIPSYNKASYWRPSGKEDDVVCFTQSDEIS